MGWGEGRGLVEKKFNNGGKKGLLCLFPLD